MWRWQAVTVTVAAIAGAVVSGVLGGPEMLTGGLVGVATTMAAGPARKRGDP